MIKFGREMFVHTPLSTEKIFNREKTLMKPNSRLVEAESFHRQITSEVDFLRVQQRHVMTAEMHCEHLTPRSIEMNCSIITVYYLFPMTRLI